MREKLKKRVKSPALRGGAKKLAGFAAQILGRVKKMQFPEKYGWDWRFEMLLEKYEPETTALVKKIVKPDMVIMDVGAHIGYYARIFSRLTGKRGQVYAFEPDAENFKLLEKNTARIGNIAITETALGEKEGRMSLYRSANTGCHSLIQKDFHTESNLVGVETLDNFRRKNHIDKIDLMKIDVEGGEPMVLSAGHETLKVTSMIIMEFTPENFLKNSISPASFFQKLEDSYGFSAYAIKNGGDIEKTAINDGALKNLTAGKESINIFLKK